VSQANFRIAPLVPISSNASPNCWRMEFTNGCFDLIRPGHVHLLARARASEFYRPWHALAVSVWAIAAFHHGSRGFSMPG
jgi:hypothetical protein